MLPRIAPEVPTSFDMMLSAGNAALIARELLNAGILEENDWTGEVSSSLQAGLQRWIWRLLEDKPLSYLSVRFAFTDDVADCWLLDTKQWSRNILQIGREESFETELGAFALLFDIGNVVFVGKMVCRLNRIQKYLGYHILRLMYYALGVVVGCQDLQNTRNILNQWGLSDHEFGRKADGTVTDPDENVGCEEFDSHVPKRAYETAFAPSALVRARSTRMKQQELFSRMEAEILDVAWEIWTIFRKRQSMVEKVGPLNEVHACGMQLLCATAVGWCEKDETQRVYDEELELCMQGDCSSVVWMQGFLLDGSASGPGSLASAVYNLNDAMRVLVLCDRLMGLMDDDARNLIRVMAGGEGCR